MVVKVTGKLDKPGFWFQMLIHHVYQEMNYLL